MDLDFLNDLNKKHKKEEKTLIYKIKNFIKKLTKKEEEEKNKIEKLKLNIFLTSDSVKILLQEICISPIAFRLHVSKIYNYNKPDALELFSKNLFILYREMIKKPKFRIDIMKLDDVVERLVKYDNRTSFIQNSDLIEKDDTCYRMTNKRESITSSIINRDSIRNSEFTTGKRSYYGGKALKKNKKK